MQNPQSAWSSMSTFLPSTAGTTFSPTGHSQAFFPTSMPYFRSSMGSCVVLTTQEILLILLMPLFSISKRGDKGSRAKLNKRNGIILGLDKLVEDMVESWGFPGGWVVKNLPAKQEMWVQSLGQEDLLDKEMATQSSILAWEIPRTEEPSGLQSMELQRVGHDLVS